MKNNEQEWNTTSGELICQILELASTWIKIWYLNTKLGRPISKMWMSAATIVQWLLQQIVLFTSPDINHSYSPVRFVVVVEEGDGLLLLRTVYVEHGGGSGRQWMLTVLTPRPLRWLLTQLIHRLKQQQHNAWPKLKNKTYWYGPRLVRFKPWRVWVNALTV